MSIHRLSNEFLKLSIDNYETLNFQEPVEENVELGISKFRRATESDIPEIELLVTENILAIFGDIPVEHKIKTSYFSLVAISVTNRIVAVACLDDFPNISAVPPSEWETWIKTLYNLQNMTAQNTLFVHFLAFHSDYMYIFLKPMFEYIFLKFPYLINVVIVVPAETPCCCFFEENFTRVLPVGYINLKKVQTLCLTWRHDYITKYKIRLAVEEDNDDLVQIIDTHSKRLREIYGDYYISEILTRFPGMKRKIIVAEVAERAVGVLILNDDVNYDSLLDNFHLETFSNLHTLAEEAVVRQCSETFPSIGDIDKMLSLGEVTSPSVCSRKSEDKMEIDDDEDLLSISDILDLERIGITNDELLTLQEVRSKKQVKTVDKIPVQIIQPELEYPVPSKSLLCFKLRLDKKVAFTLEVMAISEEHERGTICDLLEASFQSFTDTEKHYCVFSVIPSHHHFPLLNYFVRAIPQRNTLFPHEVYLLHRNSIKANLVIRKLSKKDYITVKQFVSKILHATSIIDSITRSLFGAKKGLKSFVMLNGTVIIGLIIIRHELNPNYYFFHYHCEKYIDPKAYRYDKYGLIEFCIISPIFRRHHQFFLKEVHRLSGMPVLFFKISRTELFQKTRTKPLANIMKDMLPILDRMHPNFSAMQEGSFEMPRYMQEIKTDAFSLFISTKRLCSLSRIDINSRIVVVGASCTALSFLETLVFHYDGLRHVNFNNLYLIYDRPINIDNTLSKYVSNMFIYRGRYTGNHMSSVSLHTHVNFVNGFMTAINRKYKYITIDKESIVPYDYLFLMCGAQYHHPFAEGIRKDKYFELLPENVFTINKQNDAETAFMKIHASMKSHRKPLVVIYGSCLHTFCCVTALLKVHFPNDSIKLVEPIPYEFNRPSYDPFNNPSIFIAVHDLFDILGIEVFTGYYFYEWEVDAVHRICRQVKYQSRKGFVSFNCDFIFHFENREVNFDTFTAINNAGLVYDGKIVIGPDCRTNDPYIFAAGGMTKYSRRYFADCYLHKYYNSHEIGERLARQIRAMLLPGGLETNQGDPVFEILNQSDSSKLVPQFVEPVMQSCILPGGVNYLRIRSPGKQQPYEMQKANAYFYETGDLRRIVMDEDPEYFQIMLDQYGKVEQIVCFTRKEIDVTNYHRLWGKHESTLNNLVLRYNNGEINDFYHFFKNPCFCAIYTDSFTELQEKMDNILTLLTDDKCKSIIEDLVMNLIKNDWHELTESQEDCIARKFENSQYQKQIIAAVMNYLGEHSDYLPMYAHPLITKMILYDIETSLLFKLPAQSDLSSSSGTNKSFY